nr:hypothetical protein BaRGS_006681 [Batillaria attramentaria]
MAKGDAPLILSLVLMVVSAGLFLAGFGSREWVVDTSPAITYSYSLWQKCVYSNGSATCDRIRPGTPKVLL